MHLLGGNPSDVRERNSLENPRSALELGRRRVADRELLRAGSEKTGSPILGRATKGCPRNSKEPRQMFGRLTELLRRCLTPTARGKSSHSARTKRLTSFR